MEMSSDGLKFVDSREAVSMIRGLPNEPKSKSPEIRVQPTCTMEAFIGNGVDFLRAPSLERREMGSRID
jgi:hypothetical protein